MIRRLRTAVAYHVPYHVITNISRRVKQHRAKEEEKGVCPNKHSLVHHHAPRLYSQASAVPSLVYANAPWTSCKHCALNAASWERTFRLTPPAMICPCTSTTFPVARSRPAQIASAAVVVAAFRKGGRKRESIQGLRNGGENHEKVPQNESAEERR